MPSFFLLDHEKTLLEEGFKVKGYFDLDFWAVGGYSTLIMPIKKLDKAPEYCLHEDHSLPSGATLPQGIYEHTCEGCGQRMIIRGYKPIPKATMYELHMSRHVEFTRWVSADTLEEAEQKFADWVNSDPGDLVHYMHHEEDSDIQELSSFDADDKKGFLENHLTESKVLF